MPGVPVYFDGDGIVSKAYGPWDASFLVRPGRLCRLARAIMAKPGFGDLSQPAVRTRCDDLKSELIMVMRTASPGNLNRRAVLAAMGLLWPLSAWGGSQGSRIKSLS